MSIFKIGVVQFDTTLNNKKENMKKAELYIREAAKNDAKIIVLPELFNAGYHTEEEDYRVAEKLSGETVRYLAKLSKELDIVIIANIIEQSDLSGVLYDTSFIIDNVLKGFYRKVMLWQKEQLRFKNGMDYPVIDLGFTKVGLQICYEVGFPEGARILALKGAEIICYCSAFSSKRSYVWDLATRARAIENGVFIAASNRCGQEKDDYPFAGLSRIVSPNGDIINGMDEREEGLICSEIDTSIISSQRYAVPYFRDYNTDVIVNNLVKTKM